jgi:hypothetical protein
VTYSLYERYKWETLAHLFHRFGIDGAWWEVSHVEPDDPAAQGALVRRVVLDLFDSGLIFAAYASRDDGYNLEDEQFEPVSREAVVTELDRPPDYVEPEDHLLWLIPTDKAEVRPRRRKRAISAASSAGASRRFRTGLSFGLPAL